MEIEIDKFIKILHKVARCMHIDVKKNKFKKNILGKQPFKYINNIFTEWSEYTEGKKVIYSIYFTKCDFMTFNYKKKI